jgi:hypothetical protein
MLAARLQINPNAHKITGVICGYRVEEIEDPIMQNVRRFDKLVNEPAASTYERIDEYGGTGQKTKPQARLPELRAQKAAQFIGLKLIAAAGGEYEQEGELICNCKRNG